MGIEITETHSVSIIFLRSISSTIMTEAQQDNLYLNITTGPSTLNICNNIKDTIGPNNRWMQILGQSTRVEQHERNSGPGTITLEKGVKVTGLVWVN
jgi:hypothetical protein